MTTYRISNKISGHSFGCYEADNEAEALDKLAQDAGYADYAEACTVVGGRGDLLIEVIETSNKFRTDNTEGYDTGELAALNAAWVTITQHGAPLDPDDISAQSMLDHWAETLLAEFDRGKRGAELVAWFYQGNQP